MSENLELTDRQEEGLNKMLSNKFTLLYGGSRSGKTFIIILFIFLRALKTKSRHAVLRFRFAHVKQSIWYDTMPKVAELLGIEYKDNKQDWFITLPNGSEIWFSGLDDKDRTDKVLGNEYSTIFLNEASQISYSAYSIIITRLAQKTSLKNRLFIDENPPSKAHWTYKYFINKIEPESNTRHPQADTIDHIQMNPEHNLKNLPDGYLKDLDSMPKSKRLRFLKGEFAELVEGALWTDELLNTYRLMSIERPLIKIAVSIDPAITSNQDSDETGVVVVGKDALNHGYLLEDKSGKYKPHEWATVANNLYQKWGANMIVAEKNQGGDMVEHTIKTSNVNLPVKLVQATKGKMLRAEPISAKYEVGEVHHVGLFDDCEGEMTTYTGNEQSPNRLDALVHGFTYLFPVSGSGKYLVA